MLFRRLPFAALAIFNLLVGFWTGFLRIGFELPVTTAAAHHGAIMVGGFLGTLITLEKVIPLKRKMFFAFPVASALSIILFFLEAPRVAMGLQVFASAGLILLYILYLKKETNSALVMMALGSLAWMTGTVLLFINAFYAMAFPWWLTFVFFTIVGERLELSRFLPVSQRAKGILWVVVLLMPLGVCIPFHAGGNFVSGASLMATAIWLYRYDLVRITIRKEGLTRFTGVALSIGYFFLMICGVLFMFLDVRELYSYDLLVHIFFLGFAFVMIFAHGPIILPGVLGAPVKPYHPILYVWLGGLVLSILLRIAGDMLWLSTLRKGSALLSALAIILYFVTLITLVRRGIRKPPGTI